MKVFILGGTGMLGHKLFQVLRARGFDTWCTTRGMSHASMDSIDLFHDGNVIPNIDALDWPEMRKALSNYRPEIIINCIGIVKQRPEAKASIPSIAINSLLPHRLANLAESWYGRLIHFSTDCVFSGMKGTYREEDFADATDLYGRSKYLGEVIADNALTLRTSIIGRELTHYNSLLEWFLSQNHCQIHGYTRAYYSGVTTNYMATLVARIIEQQDRLSGLYQVASRKISKFELLCLLRDRFNMDIEIIPQSEFFCDRSMNGEKFERRTGFVCPEWAELVNQIASDKTPYEKWRVNEEQTV